MPTSMEGFGSSGRFATFDPYHFAGARKKVFRLQCRRCGFEPEDVLDTKRICPKCHASSWERFPKPGSILDNHDRRAV
jgi:ABC-type ATPase with predicted acetyltransferase domain